jgi:polyketide biosynthesis acyl carrier protein
MELNVHPRDRVFEVIVKNVMDVLGDLDRADIVEDARLVDLGANSIDRADIVAASMDDLGLSFPLRELASVGNLRGLTDALALRLSSDDG